MHGMADNGSIDKIDRQRVFFLKKKKKKKEGKKDSYMKRPKAFNVENSSKTPN